MPFFSTEGDKSGDRIKHKVHLSRKIVITKYWTRYVRLIEVTLPHESSYWKVEVSDLGLRRHTTEHQRSTYEEARKVFDVQSMFIPPAKRYPLKIRQ